MPRCRECLERSRRDDANACDCRVDALARARPLGASGIGVSAFGLGLATLGLQTSRADASRQLDIASAAGVTLFDTAPLYPPEGAASRGGNADRTLGDWLVERRARGRVVLATRIGVARGAGHGGGAMRALDASLRRLRTDVIDLCQIDMPGAVPGEPEPADAAIEDLLEVLSRAVSAGKVRAVGIADGLPRAVLRLLAAAEHGLGPPLVSLQAGYSLVERSIEDRLIAPLARAGASLIARAPLAGGVLTGKYLEHFGPIAGSRSTDWARFARDHLSPQRREAVARYAALAGEHGIGLTHLALAFAASRPFVASVLLTASNSGQLDGNLAALRLVLSPALLDAIDALHREMADAD